MTSTEFIGRETELETLQRCYDSGRPQACAVYGRRRVGKTALVERFCQGKPHLRLDLTGAAPGPIMERVSEAVSRFEGGEGSVELRDFQDLVGYLGSLELGERLVVFMDELPDAVRAMDDAPSALKVYMDGRLREQNIMLIVSGSSIQWMLTELASPNRPLFQRFPTMLKVEPLSYAESRGFHPNLSEEDRMRAYAIASGIPMYHSVLGYPDLDASIKREFLGVSAGLRLETSALLSREFSSWSSYESVLSTMAGGANTLKLISERTGMSKSGCSDILRHLELIDVVESRVPYGKSGRSVTFRISDGMAAFHYGVIDRERDIASNPDRDWALERLRGRLETFYGRRFEDICAQYVAASRRCTWVGHWEGKVPELDGDGVPVRDDGGKVVTESADIDIVTRSEAGDEPVMLACECEFGRRVTGASEYRTLVRRAAAALGRGTPVRYIMLSRSGFSDELREMAEDPGSRLDLVTAEDIGLWAARANRFRLGLEPFYALTPLRRA